MSDITIQIDGVDYRLTWEYDYDVLDVGTLGDPPRSQAPLINHYKRLVGERWYFSPGESDD